MTARTIPANTAITAKITNGTNILPPPASPEDTVPLPFPAVAACISGIIPYAVAWQTHRRILVSGVHLHIPGFVLVRNQRDIGFYEFLFF